LLMYLPEWAQKFKEPKTEIRIIGGHCYNVLQLRNVGHFGAITFPPKRKVAKENETCG